MIYFNTYSTNLFTVIKLIFMNPILSCFPSSPACLAIYRNPLISISLSLSISIFLSICLSFVLSISFLFKYLSIYLSIYPLDIYLCPPSRAPYAPWRLKNVPDENNFLLDKAWMGVVSSPPVLFKQLRQPRPDKCAK